HAMGRQGETATLHEYAPKYAEYNSTVGTQDLPVRAVRQVNLVSLDTYCLEHNLDPDLIKIDVEGAELAVVQGAVRLLGERPRVVAVELRRPDFDTHYAAVVQWLRQQGYVPRLIDSEGKLVQVDDVRSALFNSGLDSDNVIFIRNR
ncbi:MAG: FkbM family methyltransferase, partial [Saprospiraceae bacterium]|nr:FkbM family methyltransferase [Saprospiraceae bacterium]